MPVLTSQLWSVLLQQRDRWVLWVPVALGLGVGIYFSLAVEPPLWLGPLALLLAVAAVAPFRANKALLLIALPFFLVALGFAAAQFRTWSVAAPILEKKTYPLTLQGRVEQVEIQEKGFRVTLGSLHWDAARRQPQAEMPTRLRVVSKIKQPPPKEGEVVTVRAVLLPLPAPAMPGGYDFRRRAFFSGLGATGYTVGRFETLTQAPADHEVYFFASLRRYIHGRIDAAIPDKDAAAVAAGILIGESKAISEDSWENIRLSGLAHLLAIAGLHTGAVTGWLFFFTRLLLAAVPFIALRYPVKKIAAGVSIAGAIFYLHLVDFFMPAERAVIMVSAVMLAIILDRDPLSLRLLAFAAAAILLARPESLVGVSFQMSFSAVGMLIAFYEGTRDWWSRLYRDKRWFVKVFLFVAGSVATTGVATLGTAPYSLFHFLRVPFISGFIANLLAVPITVMIVLPVGIISCFLMPLGLAAWPLKLVGWGTGAILKIAAVTAHWPYAAYHANAWPLPLLVIMSLGGLWLCLWRGPLRWWGLVPVLIAAALVPFAPRADILAAEGGRVFAVRAADGRLLLSPGRADGFIRDEWVEREGENGSGSWKDEGAPLSCDADACLYRAHGRLVSFVKRPEAALQDCAAADIVISELNIPRALCPQPAFLLDGNVLRQAGAQAVYFGTGGDMKVISVAGQRGARPWMGASD